MGSISPASAAQAQYAYTYLNWETLPQGAPTATLTNFDQLMSVDKKSPGSYWATTFLLDGAFDGQGNPQGGYIGVQTDGGLVGGGTGELALFSLWLADKYHGKDGKCGRFGGEGTGLHCTVKMPISPGATYRLRVKLNSTDKSGAWWGGWIKNTVTGKEKYIGELHAKYKGMHQLRSFSEYFQDLAAPHPCNRIPQSVAEFFPPQVNLTGETKKSPGTYQYQTAFTSPQYPPMNCEFDSSGRGALQGVEYQLNTVISGSRTGQVITLGTAPTSALVFSGQPATPVSQAGATFASRQLSVAYRSGQVILTGAAAGDSLTTFSVDDVVDVQVTHPDGTTSSTSHDFSDGCSPAGLGNQSSLDIGSLMQRGINDVTVSLADACGDAVGNTDVWIVGDDALFAFVGTT